MQGQAPVVPGTLYEEYTDTPHEYSINFGIKGGFTSSLFLISNFSVNGIPVNEVQNNYKIGYFGSLFMRINFDRHFLQPEISYNINRCNITFDKALLNNETPTETESSTSSITSSIHSIDVPILYGYNIIKEEPYSLAIFGGPKIRYILDKASKVSFENFDQLNIHEELRPLNVSFTLGVAVTISRIFFDFRYDLGLHNISRRVTHEILESTTQENGIDNKIRFHRRDNVLSFSLGILF